MASDMNLVNVVPCHTNIPTTKPDPYTRIRLRDCKFSYHSTVKIAAVQRMKVWVR